MLHAIIDIVQMLLWIASWIIIIQAILSWLFAFNVINHGNQFVQRLWLALDKMTAPIYRPVRKILPDFGGLDFSPLVVLLVIWCIARLLTGAADSLPLGA